MPAGPVRLYIARQWRVEVGAQAVLRPGTTGQVRYRRAQRLTGRGCLPGTCSALALHEAGQSMQSYQYSCARNHRPRRLAGECTMPWSGQIRLHGRARRRGHRCLSHQHTFALRRGEHTIHAVAIACMQPADESMGRPLLRQEHVTQPRVAAASWFHMG